MVSRLTAYAHGGHTFDSVRHGGHTFDSVRTWWSHVSQRTHMVTCLTAYVHGGHMFDSVRTWWSHVSQRTHMVVTCFTAYVHGGHDSRYPPSKIKPIEGREQEDGRN